MQVLSLALNAVQVVVLLAWSAGWITLAGLATLFTRSQDVALVMARRYWAPLHWRITGSRLTLEPLPAIDWERPHIFVMNHQSALDIPCAFAVLPVPLRFVAKHVLRRVPFLGWYMRMTGMIFVDRSNRHRALESLRLAGERIRAGASILAYPEGTRSPDGRILPFKKGPFVLALEAQVPVVPVAIDGTGHVLARGGVRLRRGHIRIKVGAPIPTVGRGPAEREALMREVRTALIRLHRDIGGAGGDEAQAIAEVGQEGLPRAPRPPPLERAG